MNHIVAISRQDNLLALAATVRAGVAAMGCAMNDVFCHAFAVGHALIEAQTHMGHGLRAVQAKTVIAVIHRRGGVHA